MQRTVVPENVIQVASEDLNGKPVSVQKSEVIEYKDGTLQSCSGTSTISVKRTAADERDWSPYDAGGTQNDDGVCGTGSFTLKLQKCYPKSTHRLSYRSADGVVMTSSSLTAVYDKG